MKNFAQPSFFRVFDLLVSLTNRGLKRSLWTHDGVEFERERHTAMGPRHGSRFSHYGERAAAVGR